ncbi:DUF6929 family protein [Cognatilysobacter bugurensis]|uniref:Uncharacterized protein n=1 Tax=Cognatilysobacter bugurensis TaxID=543356 RepID=A0A918T4D0_9GAMM|nr:hypothetical protein [Lysobacter bugurensis]GHA86235.1 hypothetical protein GCM10007067_25360 [Lysobacter bugurensis]
MVATTLVRRLEVDPASHPRGQPHISSASGLAIIGGWFYFVADDENHLIAVPADDVEAGVLQMLPLGDERLPDDDAERKRRKKDLELVFDVPAGASAPRMLVAWGSGSRPSRDVGYVMALAADGSLEGSPGRVCLAPLHDLLRRHTAELNIEAGLVVGSELHLFSRASAKAPSNGWFRIGLDAVIEFLLGDDGSSQVPAVRFAELDLGRMGGVPLGISDATAREDGGWLLSASAEHTSDAYDDGKVEGSVLLACAQGGHITWRAQLDGHHKVEGIAFDGQGALWMTTDDDAPDVPSQLRRLSWPPSGFAG